MVNAEDFTYSKGYLGLLSALGASLGITVCCAPGVSVVYKVLREKFRKRASKIVHIDEENAMADSGTPNEISLPTTQEDKASQISHTSAPWDTLYEGFRAWFESSSKPWWAVRADEENLAAGSESLDETSPSTTEGNAFQTHGRSARHSMDSCVVGGKTPPYGRLQRHRTF